MSKMIIDGRHSEEIRVALIKEEDNKNNLIDLDIEYKNIQKKQSNIYLGVVTRIEPSLEAIFVNYGSEKQGFLPFKEIDKSYFCKHKNSEDINIKDIISEGQEILVQIDKEERGNKGAALTTFISLAGCYLVLMPNNPKAGGISKRVEGQERSELKDIISKLDIPKDIGIIIRTAGVGKDISDLQWDLDVLLHQWHAIQKATQQKKAPFLIYQESDLVIRAIRDNLRKDINAIIIDDQEIYEKTKNYMESLREHSGQLVHKYDDDIPIFSYYNIEAQLESAYLREVKLPSGGSIVIDRSEALTAIDINSAQATQKEDIENTALHTNLEAAEEICRQLRLRDIGGLIVIDFIDMLQTKNQQEVEKTMLLATKSDRAKVQLGNISNFGLLEMSRQRLKQALSENSQISCPKCNGHGFIRSIESQTLSILRLAEEQLSQTSINRIYIQVPIELGAYLTNEKRDFINSLEKKYNKTVVIISNPYLEFPNYIFKTTFVSTEHNKSANKSYKNITIPTDNYIENKKQNFTPERPIVTSEYRPDKQKPEKKPLLKKLLGFIFSDDEPVNKPQHNKPKHPHKNLHHRHKPKSHSNKAKSKGKRTNRNTPNTKSEHAKKPHQKKTNPKNPKTPKPNPIKKPSENPTTTTDTKNKKYAIQSKANNTNKTKSTKSTGKSKNINYTELKKQKINAAKSD